jgi:hypothetical protein
MKNVFNIGLALLFASLTVNAASFTGATARNLFNTGAGDTYIDFESVPADTKLDTELAGMGVTFASISDVNGNPAGPYHVQLSSVYNASSFGHTIVGSPCSGCVDDGRVRYEIAFLSPQRNAGLQRIWSSDTITRFYNTDGDLLQEYTGLASEFVAYFSESENQADWVRRIEIDGVNVGGTRQVGYSDDLYFGTLAVVPEPVVWQSLIGGGLFLWNARRRSRVSASAA